MNTALEAIRDPLCQKCPLSVQGAETICMMGSGPLDARLVIIGEGPGYHEDRQGVPFVGRAGEYLDQELERAGLDRAATFVTNAVRCRPPENRNPTRAEQKACKPYLDAEMDLVKPELTVLLGNSALQAVLGQSGILKKRGAVIERDGRSYLPTVHPAAVLRNPAWAQYIQDDLLAAARFLNGKKEGPVTKVEVADGLEWVAGFCDMLARVDTPIAFDVETSTLHWWQHDGRLDCVAFSWSEGESWVIPLEHEERPLAQLLPPLYERLNEALAGKKLVGHNVKFDIEWLHSRGVRSATAFADTLIMAHLLDENRSNGLKPLARSRLGATLYEEGVDFSGGTPLDVLTTYNGRDADYTLRLYNQFRQEIIEQPRIARIYKFISMPAINALTHIEQVGFPVDYPRLVERTRNAGMVIRELEAEMLQYVDFGEGFGAPPNFRSTKFLGKWLFEQLGLPIIAVSAKTNAPSTALSTLIELRDQHPAVELLLQHRKWSKWDGTYLRPWMATLERTRNGRLYPIYNPAGTVTGRLSSNFQQVPRDPYVRSIIGARDGWTLIDADFSQIELRVAAMVSRDPSMLAAYQRGEDLHMLTAAAITGKPIEEVTKADRQIAKSANFGLLYGMGWRHFKSYSRLTYGVLMSDEQAQYTRAAFFNRYPGLRTWHDRQRRLVRAMGYVDSPIGRRRRLPAINSHDDDMAAEAERQAINSPVQGFASDLTLLAMSRIQPQLDSTVARLLGNLHDSIILEVREDVADEIAALVKTTMETLPLRRLFGYQPTVPIVAETKISQHWGEA